MVSGFARARTSFRSNRASDKHPRRRVRVGSQAAMARAHRVALYASAFILIYFLAFFAILPIPLLEPDIVAQLLPVVRASGNSNAVHERELTSELILDPLVAARGFRRLLSRISRLGPVHVSRLSRRISRVAQGKRLTPTLSRALTLEREPGLTPLRSSSCLHTCCRKSMTPRTISEGEASLWTSWVTYLCMSFYCVSSTFSSTFFPYFPLARREIAVHIFSLASESDS